MQRFTGMFTLLLVLLPIAGCPSGNPQPNPGGLNSLVLHNQHTESIVSFSVSKTGPVPGEAKGTFNLLESELAPGASFRVDNLADGRYAMEVQYRRGDRTCCSGRYAEQVFEGGQTYNWYFNVNAKAAEVVTDSIQPACAVSCFLNRLLGGE